MTIILIPIIQVEMAIIWILISQVDDVAIIWIPIIQMAWPSYGYL